jgi:hypothetical protein
MSSRGLDMLSREECDALMIVGRCKEVKAEPAIVAAFEAVGSRWPEGERNRVVRIAAERVSGRRLRSPMRPRRSSEADADGNR